MRRMRATFLGLLAIATCLASTIARAEDVAPLMRELRPRLETDSGSLTLHCAGPAVKAAVDVWGNVGPGRELMRRIKDAFDPDGIFAPGRFVEGGERP